MRRTSARIAAAGAIAALLVSGCGGGGDGRVSSPQETYDLQAAMAALVAGGETTPVTLSGTTIVNGTAAAFTGTGTLTLSPGTNGVFNATSAQLLTESISGTLTEAGQSVPYNVSVVNAFEPTSGAIVGQSQAAEYDVAESPIQIPTNVSQSPMMLGTLIRYTDSTLSVPIGRVQVSVGLQYAPVDPGSEEVVVFTYAIYDASQTLVETDTYSYNLAASGMALQFNSATAQTAAGTLTVSAQ